MYNAFLKNILLPLASLFFSGNYSRYLKEWKSYDALSSEELEVLQQKKLSEMIKYALEHVPYYQDLNLSEASKIKDFPVLSKQLLRVNNDALISQKFQKEQLKKNHSSGSSGVQSVSYMTADHTFFLRALQTHWWSWGGFSPGDPLLQAGMSLERGFVKKLKDFFFRVTYMNAFQLTDENIKMSLSRVKGKNPKHLTGYPSALNEIASYAIKNDKTMPFSSVISYGDKLFDGFRKNFKDAFGNPTIINTYGCAEGYYIGCTADLPFYYIMSPHVYLEVVDDNGMPVPDGEMGHILVTGLTNFAMPLIRYKLGDLGVLLPKESYPKNSRFNYPILQTIIGRETDVIKTPNGNTLIVHSFTGILEYYPEIVQFKIIQESAKNITIEYRSDTVLSNKTKNEILDKLNALAENSMHFQFKKMNRITPTGSGKPQIMEIRSAL